MSLQTINKTGGRTRRLVMACSVVLSLTCFRVPAGETIGHLQQYLQDLHTLQVNFTQTLHNEQGEKLETAEGVLYLQHPGKFHWAYGHPYIQKIITDGNTLWVYDEDLEQVTIRDVSESINQTPAAVIIGNEDMEKHFVTREMGEIEGYDWVELTPRDTEAQYSSIRLGFDQDNLDMMILHDNLGQVTRIDFSDARRNQPLDAGLFTFDPPPGVDVVDDRE